jgi:tetratricopeptide (TPR) repeat protein
VKRDWRAWILAAAMLLPAVALYAQVVDFDFIWDDPIIFQRQLPYFDSFENVFFPPKSIPQFGVHYYRPVTIVSYQLDEWVAKTFWPEAEREQARRVVYHASVVVYHGLVVLLLTVFAVRLLQTGPGRSRGAVPVYTAGAAGALVFMTHPLHVESVAWMAGRTDVLCALFVLGSLVAFDWLKRGGGWPAFAISVACALAAMLAKETGVVLVALIPVFDLAFADRSGSSGGEPARLSRAERRRQQRSGRRTGVKGTSRVPTWARWGGVIAVTLLYFALRHDAVGGRQLTAAGEPLGRLLGAVTWYAGKLLWPPPQSGFVHAIPRGAAVWIGGALVVVGLAALVWLWRRAGWRAEAVALLLSGATLAPSLAIAAYRISETPLAERYGYLPSAGMCLLLAALLCRGMARLPASWSWPVRAVPVVAMALLIAIPSAKATWERSGIWRNDLAFWTDTAAKAPQQGLPHLHLGMTYAARDRLDEAEEQYRKALATYDDAEGLSKAYNNLGALYMRQGRLREGAEALRGALNEVPNYPTAHYNLGLIELNLAQRAGEREARKERLGRARHHLRRALELNPRYVKAHLQYGRLLLSTGDASAGVRHLRRAAQLAPSSGEAARARELIERAGAR